MLQSAAPEVTNEGRKRRAAAPQTRASSPQTRASSPLAANEHHSNLEGGNYKPKRRVSRQGQRSSEETHEAPPAYRTTASGRRCNPRPNYVDESDEEEDEDGEDVQLSDSDASDDEDFKHKNKLSAKQITEDTERNKRMRRTKVNQEDGEEYQGKKVKYRGVTRKCVSAYCSSFPCGSRQLYVCSDSKFLS